MYVSYEYYSEVYGGEVPEDKFVKLEIKASGILNYYTFNRIEVVDDRAKLAICELIDNIEEFEKTGGKEIASEKVATYAVTYVGGETKSNKSKQKNIVAKYFGLSGLMYRGVR